MKTKHLILFFGLTIAQQSLSQGHTPTGNIPNTSTNDRAASAWYRGGNLGSGVAGTNNIFGTRWQSDIFVMTNNTTIGQFTHGSILSTVTGDFGDGLRILAPAGNSGNLDLFTSGSNGQNETHVRWGGSGQISGQNNRFEILSIGIY